MAKTKNCFSLLQLVRPFACSGERRRVLAHAFQERSSHVVVSYALCSRQENSARLGDRQACGGVAGRPEDFGEGQPNERLSVFERTERAKKVHSGTRGPERLGRSSLREERPSEYGESEGATRRSHFEELDRASRGVFGRGEVAF